MRRGALFVLALLVALAAAGCSRSQTQGPPAGVTLALATTPDPPKVGPSTLTLTLKDKTGTGIEGATIAIKGDMTHPGMAPVLATIQQQGGGVYRAPFEWTMGGDWIVTAQVTLADGRSFAQEFDLTVKGSD